MKLCRPLRSGCLFSLLSHENKESLFIQFYFDLSLLINMSSPKLHSAPLKHIKVNTLAIIIMAAGSHSQQL